LADGDGAARGIPTHPADAYAIRPIRDAETLRRCEALQAEIWRFPPVDIVPLTQLVAAVSAGGLVLGAFGPDGALVGFAYAFPAWRGGRALWYSHMAGVVPASQGVGLGLRLKRAQRDAALAAGLDEIVWTYDPLQAGNARFNFTRLGGIARRYHVDYYGVMNDAINHGLPSDRFEIDWQLQSPRVLARLAGEGAPRLPSGLPWAVAAEEADGPDASVAPPRPPDVSLAARALLVEIPRDLTGLKATRPDVALRWRDATRAAFRHYLTRGYTVTEAVRFPDEHGPRVVYLLVQEEARP